MSGLVYDRRLGLDISRPGHYTPAWAREDEFSRYPARPEPESDIQATDAAALHYPESSNPEMIRVTSAENSRFLNQTH